MRTLAPVFALALMLAACGPKEAAPQTGLAPSPPPDSSGDAPTTVNPLPDAPQAGTNTPPVLPEVIPEANPPVAPK